MVEKDLIMFEELSNRTISRINKKENIRGYLENEKGNESNQYSRYIYKNSTFDVIFEFKSFNDLIENKIFNAYYKNLSENNKYLVHQYIGLFDYLPNNLKRGYRSSVNIIGLDILITLLCLEEVSFNIYEYINGKEYFSDYSNFYMYKIEEIIIAVLLNDNDSQMLEFIKKMIYDNENVLHFSEQIIKGVIMSNNQVAIEYLIDLFKSAKLSEGLRTSVLSYIDYGSIETFKKFLQIIREDKLLRFSSVKTAFVNYTGIYEHSSGSKIYEMQAQYIFDCILDNKSEEYLESDNALKTYIALYSLATNDFDYALEYIDKNIYTSMNYKKSACRVVNDVRPIS